MKQSILTPLAPTPIGPFSQAIIAGNLVFVSAQLAMKTQTGNMMMRDIEEETTQVLVNIDAILDEAGVKLKDVVKASIFLKDMADYDAVNRVYEGFFEPPYPARETIQVGALPKYVNIEISVIAMKP